MDHAEQYRSFQKGIEEQGLFPHAERNEEGMIWRVVCSSKPGGGNSFWVALGQNGWILGTWGPAFYKVPHTSEIVNLCAKLLDRTSWTCVEAPDDIIQTYALEEIPEDVLNNLLVCGPPPDR